MSKRKERKKAIRLKMIEFYKKNCCVDCGECDPRVLDFDHINNKLNNISDLLRKEYSWESITKEAAKCEVRCSNCHRRKTAIEQKHYTHKFHEEKVVAVSGGLDPVHINHYSLIKEAAKHGKVVVILNSDEWLVRKKGYAFMKFEERKAIMEMCKYVTHVTHVDDSDNTVCEALRRIKPDYFANGGDRKSGNIPEYSVCEELGIEMLFGIGASKTQSSSWLVNDVVDKVNKLRQN